MVRCRVFSGVPTTIRCASPASINGLMGEAQLVYAIRVEKRAKQRRPPSQSTRRSPRFANASSMTSTSSLSSFGHKDARHAEERFFLLVRLRSSGHHDGLDRRLGENQRIRGRGPAVRRRWRTPADRRGHSRGASESMTGPAASRRFLRHARFPHRRESHRSVFAGGRKPACPPARKDRPRLRDRWPPRRRSQRS